MVTYLNDLIAELPDKKTLTDLDDIDEFRYPKLPDLDLIEEIPETLTEKLKRIKERIKKNLETPPKPEEQLSSEPPSIEKKLLDYQKAIDALANRAESGTYIFLDNIFPIPLVRNEYLYYANIEANEPRYFVKYPLIKAYAQVLSSWRKLLQTNYNRIFIPQECWSQAQAGRICLEGTEKDERRSKFLSGKGLSFINSDLKQYLQEFAGLRDDCGQESAMFPKPAGNIFYVRSADKSAYNSLISQVIDLSKKGGLKQKRNGNAHKDDAHADEILVASAIYQTIKTKSPGLIVSNDKGVDRIRQAYLKQFEQDYPKKERLNIDFTSIPQLDNL